MQTLRFTGHAFLDIGLAGICALTQRARPEDLTIADLDVASAFMEKEYYRKDPASDARILHPFLSCVFPNSSFVQPETEKPKTRAAFVQQYLYAHLAEPHPSVRGLSCAFTGEPATCPLVRTHLPLMSGEDVMNFCPPGRTFVPASGPYVTALMFLPMASRRAEGKLLAVQGDDPELTLWFARRYFADNLRLLSLPFPMERALTHPGYDREQPKWDAAGKRYKFADVKGPRSFVVSDLLQFLAEHDCPGGLTVHLLSNSGQGATQETFTLPYEVVSFLSLVRTMPAWQALAARFWPVAEEKEDKPQKKGKRPKASAIPGRAGWTRNPVFEDLCTIFQAGTLQTAAANKWLSYVTHDWTLFECFMREVNEVKSAIVDMIKSVAGRLSDHIVATDNRRLLRIVRVALLNVVRHNMIRALYEAAGRNHLLFSLDEFLTLFPDGDDDDDRNRYRAFNYRNALAVRLVEDLHQKGYFERHPEDATAEPTAEDLKEFEGTLT